MSDFLNVTFCLRYFCFFMCMIICNPISNISDIIVIIVLILLKISNNIVRLCFLFFLLVFCFRFFIESAFNEMKK